MKTVLEFFKQLGLFVLQALVISYDLFKTFGYRPFKAFLKSIRRRRPKR